MTGYQFLAQALRKLALVYTSFLYFCCCSENRPLWDYWFMEDERLLGQSLPCLASSRWAHLQTNKLNRCFLSVKCLSCCIFVTIANSHKFNDSVLFEVIPRGYIAWKNRKLILIKKKKRLQRRSYQNPLTVKILLRKEIPKALWVSLTLWKFFFLNMNPIPQCCSLWHFLAIKGI